MFHNLKTAQTIGSLRNFDPLKPYYLFNPKEIPNRYLNIQQEFHNSSDSAHINSDCILTTVAQSYPRLSKVFDHPLNDKARKIYDTLASQHYSYSKVLFLTAQSAVFVFKKNKLHNTWTSSESVPYARVATSAKVLEYCFEIEHVNFN